MREAPLKKQPSCLPSKLPYLKNPLIYLVDLNRGMETLQSLAEPYLSRSFPGNLAFSCTAGRVCPETLDLLMCLTKDDLLHTLEDTLIIYLHVMRASQNMAHTC